MRPGFRSVRVMWFSLSLLGASPLKAQSPPPESTSKVKRILLYNYNGGWNCIQCREKAQEVFLRLAQAKGFGVDTTSSVSFLTPDNLKPYQVIVWNNNHNGAASVPEVQAQKAVSEFVRQGGGWMLVNLANEHTRNWRLLDSLMGPGTSGWRGEIVPAVLVADSAARKHPELRFFIAALPDSIPLRTNWLSVVPFTDSAHIQPLYRLKNAAWLSGRWSDRYIWAGTHQEGRALALPLGWSGGYYEAESIMAQADSAVPRLYWQGLRWLAGDYQGGCIKPDMANFDPDARVDDGSCPGTGIWAGRRRARAPMRFAAGRVLLATPVPSGGRIRLFDLRGDIVWENVASQAAAEFALPEGLSPGLYFLETTGTGMILQARIPIP